MLAAVTAWFVPTLQDMLWWMVCTLQHGHAGWGHRMMCAWLRLLPQQHSSG